MSRVYFHSPSGTAALAGAERLWLRHLAVASASAAWGLDGAGFGLETAEQIIAMVPEVPEGVTGRHGYLHPYLREAQAAMARRDYSLNRRLLDALKTAVSLGDLELNVQGVRLRSVNLDLNTALAAGSDPVALAAKVYGWCESHCWVEGPDRGWLADIIEEGLSSGLYRTGLGWESRYADHDEGDGVLPLLCARNDEPVVLSYSVTESFPDELVGDWMPPWPDGVERDWNALTEAQQEEREARREQFTELPYDEQWGISMRGLRETRSWAQLSADRLRTQFFHLPLTVHDVMRPDRAEHLRSVLASQPEFREEATVR
jgi:hypothetical protein